MQDSLLIWISDMEFFIFVITLLACGFGKICGMGGGVIIKPVMDALGLFSIASVNFYSSCTVLSMSGYSVCRSLGDKNKNVDLYTSTLLGVGAAVGGLAGKSIYRFIAELFASGENAGAVQAILLFLLTAVTMVYTGKKDDILGYSFRNPVICIVIGMILGGLGAFLGIGGGPFNMAALYFFFSMSTKKAAENSLYIIMISQISALFKTIFNHTIPEFNWKILIGMIICGILGSEIGRVFNKRLSESRVSALFRLSMIMVMGLCIYNFVRYILL